MPSVILSDNGVSSGSAGLKSTAASDGALALQTTTAGGTATTAVYVDTSQLVGLGTTPAAKLHLLTTGNTTADGVRLTFGSEARSHNIYSALATGRDLTIAPYRALTINTGSGTNEGVLTLNAYEYTVFGTGSSYTERMRLDASGNLGIGTTSFSRRVNFAIADSTAYNSSSFEATPLCTYIRNTDATIGSYAGLQFAIGNNSDAAIAGVRTADASCAITFGTRNVGSGSIVERARIDSSGNLLVGTTSAFSSGKVCVQVANGSTQNGITIQDNGTSGFAYIGFSNGSGSTIGSVSRVGTTSAVVYNTTSDARLKSNIEDAAPVLNKLMQVQVRQYDWTEGDLHQDYGFIAQELEPLLSGVVTKGKTEEDFWQLDYARLTPHLVKAIQELKAELDTAKAEIAALKGTQP